MNEEDITNISSEVIKLFLIILVQILNCSADTYYPKFSLKLNFIGDELRLKGESPFNKLIRCILARSHFNFIIRHAVLKHQMFQYLFLSPPNKMLFLSTDVDNFLSTDVDNFLSTDVDNFQIAYPQHGETFEEWGNLSHLKDSTLDVLRSNEIDDLSTVRLLNAEDIKV